MNRLVIPVTALVASLTHYPVFATDSLEQPQLPTIVVSATKVEFPDIRAPYASEVHTRQMIKKSGARTLYDYLGKQTSVAVLPSFGNPFSQLIEMRGYGLEAGYQNIVVTVNGRRMNNIDLSAQLLSSIPLNSIERIEITKGSGSVVYGDGATAGSIQIYTKPVDGAQLGIQLGSDGIRNGDLSVSMNSEFLDIAFLADHYRQDGFSNADIAGFKDEAEKDGVQLDVSLFPSDKLELSAHVSTSDIENRYPGPLTLVQYKDNPAGNGGNVYSHQIFETDIWTTGVSYDLNDNLEVSWDHSDEKKLSNFVSWLYKSDYDYQEDQLLFSYEQAQWQLLVGGNYFDGKRIGIGNTTSKQNKGIYFQGYYQTGAFLYSAGYRHENVEYLYSPFDSTELKDDYNLDAWDVGVNYSLSRDLNLFANVNKSFQAPDIDRFFSYDFLLGKVVFNGLIAPEKVNTLNIGANWLAAANQLKISLFYADLEDEIFYNPLTTQNTNIDSSHKYGVEIQDNINFSDNLKFRVNYNYVQAIIDHEDTGAGGFDGKKLPGVSDHGLTLGMEYQVTPMTQFSVSHTFRSEAYALEDFSNTAMQKQEAYHSTDMNISYRYHDRLELSLVVENIFEQDNGIWVRDDVIYPVNFTRNIVLGAKINLF